MITREQIITTQYFSMLYDLKLYVKENIFPEFNNVYDIVFYFYNFLGVSQRRQAINNIFGVYDIKINEERFEKVCLIIIDFIETLQKIQK